MSTPINSLSLSSLINAKPLITTSPLASLSSNTGALIVSGGAGIGGSINAGGSLNVGHSIIAGGSIISNGTDLFLFANGAYVQANTNLNSINYLNTYTAYGYAQANGAFVTASAAFVQANTTASDVVIAQTTADNATLIGQSAFDKANTVLITAQAAFNKANTGGGGGLKMSITEDVFLTAGQNNIIDQFPIISIRSVKYQIQVVAGTSYQLSEVILIHDGVNSFWNEYSIIRTGSSLGTFSADIIFGSDAVLYFNPNQSGTEISIIKTPIYIENPIDLGALFATEDLSTDSGSLDLAT